MPHNTSKARLSLLAAEATAPALKRTKKNKQIPKRTPQRARFEATVEAIFEASARILARGGRAGFSTNRIAEVAGNSIAKLYGYFPDKQAILLAIARRELNVAPDSVAALLLDTDAEMHPARRAIRVLINVYNAGGKVCRILMETLFSHGGSEEFARPIAEIADALVA